MKKIDEHGPVDKMRRCLNILIIVLTVVAGTVSTQAAVSGSASDEQIVSNAELVASGTLFEIYQHGTRVDPAFLKIMERAYEQVQKVTGLTLDTATLGPKVHVYVSNALGVSHVWKGYQHPRDPKGFIFLNSRVYRGALSGNNATYIHELTHLFTWKYRSHTLREGIADYVALTILPGAAVGPNEGEAWSPSSIPSEVLEFLGTVKPIPVWVTTDPLRRSAYYFASYRFAKYLVERENFATFMKLYASDDPESDIKTLYGISREEAVKAVFAPRF